MQRCQVSRFLPLQAGATLSILAMSVPTNMMVSRCQVWQFQLPPLFPCNLSVSINSSSGLVMITMMVKQGDNEK